MNAKELFKKKVCKDCAQQYVCIGSIKSCDYIFEWADKKFDDFEKRLIDIKKSLEHD